MALVLPQTLEEWIGFDFPEDTWALFLADKGKEKMVMNKLLRLY